MNQKKDKIQLSDHFTYGAVYFLFFLSGKNL